jgi:hypothetical protein
VCPHRRWMRTNPASMAGIQRMLALGFEMVADRGSETVVRAEPMTVDLHSVEELVAFQERVGARLILDGATLEIDAG